MSFILDSLKESDRNREQSEVPGLNTVHDVPAKEPTPKTRLLLPYLLVGALLLNAGVLLWWLGSGDEGERTRYVKADPELNPAYSSVPPQDRQPSAVQPSADPVAEGTRLTGARKIPAIAETPSGRVLPEVVKVKEIAKIPDVRKGEVAAVAGGSAPPLAGSEGPEVKVGIMETERRVPVSPEHETPLAEPVSAVADRQVYSADKVIEQPAPVANTTPSRIYDVRELPPSVRQALPTMSVPGFAYTSNPASRMVIINGKVLREGEFVTSGLRLEEITPKGAILSCKGYLLRISSQPD